jgi:uncharacterized protein (DUF1697 family)
VRTYVALLRGINVGGHRQVAMSDLRAFLSKLGFQDPHSILQSGNLIFRSSGRTTAQLEQLLEVEAEKRLALHTDFFVRSAEEIKALVAHNPFREEARRDPSHLLALFLKHEPRAQDVKALQASIKGREAIEVVGRQAYIVYPDGIGTSRLASHLIDKTLGTRGTGRNWNTVLKLNALSDAPGGPTAADAHRTPPARGPR